MGWKMTAIAVAAPCVVIACCQAYKWWVSDPYALAKKQLHKECAELSDKFSKRSLHVLATLDVIEEDVDALRHGIEAVDGEHLPVAAAYKFSRIVRERMCYPTRSRANRIVAADHLRSAMEDACVRPHQRVAIMPLALEMVFMCDKHEAMASRFRNMIAGTWREASETVA